MRSELLRQLAHEQKWSHVDFVADGSNLFLDEEFLCAIVVAIHTARKTLVLSEAQSLCTTQWQRLAGTYLQQFLETAVPAKLGTEYKVSADACQAHLKRFWNRYSQNDRERQSDSRAAKKASTEPKAAAEKSVPQKRPRSPSSE